MKKGVKINYIILAGVLFVILFIGFVSASLLGDIGDFFKNIFGGGVTGKVVSGNETNTTYDKWCNWTDVNKDGKVNSQDVTLVRNNFTGFSSSCNVSNRWCNWYDVNKDGKVNSQDVTIIRNHYTGFGGPCYGCLDVCSYLTKRCSGDISQICDDKNLDYCLEWVNDNVCKYGCESSTGQCKICVPNCAGKQCGDDNCGGSCGSCGSGYTCNSTGQCILNCTPKTCTQLGKTCGNWNDGCGTNINCQNCTSGYFCNSTGQCVSSTNQTNITYEKWCNWNDVNKDGKVNSQDVTLVRNNYTGFSSSCSITNRWCNWLDVNKDGKVNSQDVTLIRNSYTGFGGPCYGCYDQCNYSQKRCSQNYIQICNDTKDVCLNWFNGSYCTNGCDNGTCINCIPKNCSQLNKQCGNWSDECNGTISCGDCSGGQTCTDQGQCINPIQNNLKNMSKYSEKEAFLISDKNWKDVLPLVPVTTWTGSEADCQRGYGTPENVCVYPTLIWHEENITKKYKTDFYNFYIIDNQLKKISNVDEETNNTFKFLIIGDKVILYLELQEGIIAVFDFLQIYHNQSNNNYSFIGLGSNYYNRLLSNEENKILIDLNYDQPLFSITNENCSTIIKIIRTDFHGNYIYYKILGYNDTYTANSMIIDNCGFSYNMSIKGEFPYIIEITSEKPYTFNKIMDKNGNYFILPNSDKFPTTNISFYILNKTLAENPIYNYTSIDVDSIIYFMQQYSPTKLDIIGSSPQELDNLLITQPELGAGLEQNQIQRITPENYLSYWKEFKDVVYVDDNYELALIASTYASLINAPLIIKGSSLDLSEVFNGRDIICVGNVNPNGSSCKEQYNLEQLQQKYIERTNTDKIILINPEDINSTFNQEFVTKKSINSIENIYTKNSLSAAFLSSAKHELIITTRENNADSVKEDFENNLIKLNFIPKYLTIMSSPVFIEMSKINQKYNKYLETDSKFRNISFGKNRIYVGRIFGLTSSDVSSYVSRILFYQDNSKKSGLVIVNGVQVGDSLSKWGVSKLFQKIGIETLSFINYGNVNSSNLINKDFIVYSGHGTGSSWTGVVNSNNIPDLNNSIVFSESCSSCAFEAYLRYSSNLFCSNMIRKGAILFFGGTTDIVGGTHHTIWINKFLSGEESGNSYYSIEPKPSQTSVLLGDPTFKLSKNLQEKSSISNRYSNISVNLNLIGFYNSSDSGVLFSTNGDEITRFKYGESIIYYGYSAFLSLGPLVINEKYNIEKIPEEIYLNYFETENIIKSYILDNKKYFDLYYQLSHYYNNFSLNGEFYNFNFSIILSKEFPVLYLSDNIIINPNFNQVSGYYFNNGSGKCLYPILTFNSNDINNGVDYEFLRSINPYENKTFKIFRDNQYDYFNFSIKCISYENE